MLSALGDASGMPQRAMSRGERLHPQGRPDQALPEQLRVIVGGANAYRAAQLARQSAEPEPAEP